MTATLSLGPVAAEIWLALSGMTLLMVGVFRGNRATRLVAGMVVIALAVAMVAVLAQGGERHVAMGGLFVVDAFGRFMKALVLVGSAVTLIMSLGYIRREEMERFEYPLLVLFATLGMLMMVSANDLMALYVGLELQSLALYVIAAFQRDSLRSTEAGLKYFVLGALASGLLLYGCSLVYGFSGTTRFDVLAGFFSESLAAQVPGDDVVGPVPPVGLIVGLVFVVAGLAFKVSAVPFHMWTPDVYEGAPTPVTAFFSVAPKIAAMALFLRVMLYPFGDFVAQWQQIIIFVSVASMLLGAFGALAQYNIKRLMAYSSIGHVGYALIGIATGTELGARGVLIYLAIYLVMNAGTFGCILAMRRKERMVESISDLAGLSKSQPALALALGIFMFAMAGIPPLSGFFGKFFIFQAAIEAKLYTLAVIGVMTSVVAAVYYLRIVKIMYFDEAADPFDVPMGRELSLVVAVAGVVTLFFFIYPSPLLSGAQAAASSLFP